MSVNEIFKTEFKGYSKKEVAEYIVTLNTQMESLKSELDSCESELQKYKDELAEKNVNFAPSDEQLEEMRASLTAEIRAELEPSLRKEITLELEATSHHEESADSVTVSRKELEALKNDSEIYADQKNILAELMIKAKSDAADIYADAEKKADKLLQDAFDRFAKLQSDFEQMRSNVLASKTEMETRSANIGRYLDDFTQYLNFMGQDITNTGENFKNNI